MGIPTEELLDRTTSRELQEYHTLFAVQAEERGDLPPPEPDDDDDDEPDDLTDADIEALVQAERDRLKGLKDQT